MYPVSGRGLETGAYGISVSELTGFYCPMICSIMAQVLVTRADNPIELTPQTADPCLEHGVRCLVIRTRPGPSSNDSNCPQRVQVDPDTYDVSASELIGFTVP